MNGALVGRSQELSRAHAALARAEARSGALLFFTGEPGIGKTRLADHTASLCQERGMKVVWGRCWEAGGAPAYWPWIEVFRELGIDDDPFGSAFSQGGSEASQGRFVLFDRAVRTLAQAAHRQPLVIVLDDLHAADVPSLLVLQLLARSLRTTPLLVIGTYREVEARLCPEHGPLLDKIGREGEVLSLGRLNTSDLDAWLAEAGASQQVAAGELHRLTEGNPLFVSEALRALECGRELELSSGTQTLIAQHLSRLSPRAREVCSAAAVLGREFKAETACAAFEFALDETAALLGEAALAGVLVRSSNGYTFSHILLRDQLYGELAPSRRAALHWQVGQWLARKPGELSMASHHLIEGHEAGEFVHVLEVARDAAQEARRRVAFEDAARLASRALALTEGKPPTHVGCELQLIAAEALQRAGQSKAGKQLALDAASVARTLGADELFAKAALAYAAEFVTGAVDPIMVGLLHEALSRLEEGDHPLRALCMARLAAAMVPPREDEVPEIIRLAYASVDMARRIGDPQTLLYTSQFASAGAGYLIGSEERMVWMKEFIELAIRLDEKLALINLLGWYMGHLLESGRRAEADATLADYEKFFDDFPQGRFRWRLLAIKATFATFDGDYAQVLALSDEWLAIAENERVAQIAWAFQRICLAYVTDDVAQLERDSERIIATLSRMPNMAPNTAWVYGKLGQHDKARQYAQGVLEHVYHFPWLLIAAEAVVILGDVELARAFYAPLAAKAFSQRFFWGPGGVFAFGPTPRTLGDLALILGEPHQALEHFNDALALCETAGAKPLIRLTQQSLERLFAKHPELRAGAAKAPARPSTPAPTQAPLLEKDGEVWSVRSSAGSFRLKDSKGVVYLDYLLRHPGREVHVLELVGSDEFAGDAGPVLDAKAKEQYRRRLEDLRDQLEEANQFGDRSRAANAEAEIEALADQLASAVGLGGRDRKAASSAERARVNVQRRLKDAIERLSELDPAAGRYLSACVKTGTYCSFHPV